MSCILILRVPVCSVVTSPPVACRQWDRYAQFEYMKLAEEEEGGVAMDGAGDENSIGMGSW